MPIGPRKVPGPSAGAQGWSAPPRSAKCYATRSSQQAWQSPRDSPNPMDTRTLVSPALKTTFATLAFLSFALGLTGCGDGAPTNTASPATAAGGEAPAAGNLRIGARLPDFELPDYFTGDKTRLADLVDGESYVAVLWHSPSCPCARNCAAAISAKLTPEDYPDLRVIGITSDAFWDFDWFKDDLAMQVDEGLLTFPVLLDKDRSVMEVYGAERTPTVWLADKDGTIRFFGAPENTLVPEGEDYRFLLKEAVDALRAGNQPDVVTFAPIGCPIDVPFDEGDGAGGGGPA